MVNTKKTRPDESTQTHFLFSLGASSRDLLGKRFPVKILMVALVMPMAIMGVMGWLVWKTYWDFQETQFRDVRLRELYSRIIYLDEMLTTSARMAVATGNVHWEKRYLGFMPQREAATIAALELAPEALSTKEAATMNTAKRRLLDLETSSLDAVQSGRLDVARALVFGQEYDELKKLYSEGMDVILNILQRRTESALHSQRRRTIFAVSSMAIALPILLFAWLGVLRMVSRYISDRKKVEEQMRETMDLKYAFTSMVSHELRTPLAAIKENIDIVLDQTAGELNNDQQDFLSSAKTNVDRLSRLINDVLDYQKLETRQMNFRMEEADMNEVIQETVESMRPIIESRNVTIQMDLDPRLPQVAFDRDRIIQVLLNLLNNAIKFTSHGKISVISRRAGQDIQIAVRDTGIGIRKDDIEKLFRSFSQVSNPISGSAKGTGLGLAICKEILSYHHGEMWVESEYGRGSIFYFKLPLSTTTSKKVGAL